MPCPKCAAANKGPRILLSAPRAKPEWNRNGQFQGQIDVPLNDNRSAPREEKGCGGSLKNISDWMLLIPATWLGPRKRRKLSSKHHPGLTLHSVNELQEISHGEWEGKFEAEIESGYPGMLHQWQDRTRNGTNAGGRKPSAGMAPGDFSLEENCGSPQAGPTQ